jgi:glucose/arabinose dehydrogenase
MYAMATGNGGPFLILFPIMAALLAACGSGIPAVRAPTIPAAQDAQTGLTLPTGWRSEVLIGGLSQPTHAAFAPDGSLYIAQLNGAENAGRGQVLRLRPDSGTGSPPTIVLSDLLKPTGLAWADGALYLVAREAVLVSRPNAGGALGTPELAAGPFAFNGRSNGQIAVGPDGLLYFQSTGDENAPETSGFIYAAEPSSGPLTPERVAQGLKNAYAFAWNPVTGQMYTTEIGDGTIEGVGAPPEELNIVWRGGNYGWPRCYADQQEDKGRGGERIYCSDTDVPLAIFPPRSTPTGLAYFNNSLIVALWAGGKLVSVAPNTGAVTDLVTGLQQPTALVVTPDGRRLLVIDGEAGVIYALSRP